VGWTVDVAGAATEQAAKSKLKLAAAAAPRHGRRLGNRFARNIPRC
jgi:hypothetical protein